jgi:hypothetical protein
MKAKARVFQTDEFSGRLVGGAVVDDDNLQILTAVGQYRVDSSQNNAASVARWNNN